MQGGHNAFLLCAMGGHLAVAEYLAPRMEGHLFDSDDTGYTALHWAARKGQLPMVKYLMTSCGLDEKTIDEVGLHCMLQQSNGLSALFWGHVLDQHSRHGHLYSSFVNLVILHIITVTSVL